MRRWWTSLIVFASVGLLWRSTQPDPLANSLTRVRHLVEARVGPESSATVAKGRAGTGKSRDFGPAVVRPLAPSETRSDAAARTLKLGRPVDPQALRALVLSSSVEEPVLFEAAHCVVVVYFSPGEGLDPSAIDRVVQQHLPEGHLLSQSIIIGIPVPGGRVTVSPYSGSDSIADAADSLHAVMELVRAAFE